MSVVYLDTALDDLIWWRKYYRVVFPEGGPSAGRQFLKIVALLETRLRIGHPTDEPEVFEYPIPRTPFSLIYRLRGETVEVLRVWDNRRAPRDS